MEKDITEWLLDYVLFFRDRGYLVPPDFPERCLSAMATLDIQSPDADEMESLLRTMTVQSTTENVNFAFDFDDFVHNRKSKISKKDAEDQLSHYYYTKNELETRKQKRQDIKKNIEKGEKKLKKIRKKKEDYEKNAKSKRKKLLEERKNSVGDYDALFEKIEDENERKIFQDCDLVLLSTERVASIISKLLKECIGEPDGLEMMRFLRSMLLARKNIGKIPTQDEENDAIDYIKQRKAELQRVEDEIEKFEEERRKTDEEKLILKLQSYIHRDQFRSGHAVQLVHERELPQYFKKKFSELTETEKKNIRNYIFENARDFRTRMARSIRTGQQRKIDISETCKAACATGGVPMRLCYEKPVRSKANLVMLLDISGSCSDASEMMLYFMSCMHEVFPGGCRAYVFVNKLFDISDALEEGNVEGTMGYIYKNIPVRGVYSNYYRPLKEFHNEHMSEINKDSLVFFIGDARNNRNESGEEFLREICRKCRKAIWINTDAKEKWNQGDSIIGKYKPYLRAVNEVLTPEDLLICLDNIRNA